MNLRAELDKIRRQMGMDEDQHERAIVILPVKDGSGYPDGTYELIRTGRPAEFVTPDRHHEFPELHLAESWEQQREYERRARDGEWDAQRQWAMEHPPGGVFVTPQGAVFERIDNPRDREAPPTMEHPS
jgi:hypothetical protein